MADPYSTLGVARTASEKEIKSAYRKLAKELHPDRNKDNPQAAERFGKVTNAYDLLSDKEKRAQFDRGEIDAEGNPTNPFAGMGGGYSSRGGFGQDMGGGFSSQQFDGFGSDGIDLGDIFDGLFSGGGARPGRTQRQAPPRRGADVAYRLKVPFREAAICKAQRITLGDGKTIDLKLPAGVENGTQMRLKGKGEPGPAGPGDAIVTIIIASDPLFTRSGDNIRVDLPITLDEAVNGASVRCPTASGAVMLTIKPGTSGGTVMRLKGKGFSKKGGGNGDQLVNLEISLPDNITDLASRLEGWHDDSDPRSTMGG